MTMTRLIAPLVAALLAVFSASAMAKPAVVAPAATPSSYVQSVGELALSTISNPSLSDADKRATLEKLFHENLDFQWVAQFVMGRYWRQATDEQKARYVDAYKNFLTKHYTSRFSEYTSGSFKITGEKPGTDTGETVVGMEIKGNNAGEPPILIDYRVRAENGGYKVFDIIVEGVSLIQTQRSEFGAVLNKEGIDGLISRLQAK